MSENKVPLILSQFEMLTLFNRLVEILRRRLSQPEQLAFKLTDNRIQLFYLDELVSEAAQRGGKDRDDKPWTITYEFKLCASSLEQTVVLEIKSYLANPNMLDCDRYILHERPAPTTYTTSEVFERAQRTLAVMGKYPELSVPPHLAWNFTEKRCTIVHMGRVVVWLDALGASNSNWLMSDEFEHKLHALEADHYANVRAEITQIWQKE